MGKGGSFSNWLKEFCTIVLIQSLQAFLFSIIVVLIVTSYNQSKADESSKALGLGVVGVVGLASLSKLEDLVKKMLGVGGSFDPSMKLSNTDLATGLMAGKIAGRVLNNGSNMAKGASGFFKANKDIKKTKQSELRRLNLSYDKPPKKAENNTGVGGNTQTNVEGNTQTSVEGNTTQNTLNPSKARAKANNYGDIANKARRNNVGGSGASGAVGSNDDVLAALTNAINESGGGKINNGKAQLKEDELSGSYAAKIEELKRKRGDSIALATKGLTGTVGASFAGIAGGVIGGATGDVGNTLKGVGAGMGAGDYLGEKSVDLARKAYTGPRDAIKSVNKTLGEIKKGTYVTTKQIDKELNKRREEVNAMFDNINIDHVDKK